MSTDSIVPRLGPRLQRPGRTAEREGSAGRVVTHYSEQHSQALDVLGEFVAGHERRAAAAAGPRVVMHGPDEGAAERRAARNKILAYFGVMALVLVLGALLKPRAVATAQPADVAAENVSNWTQTEPVSQSETQAPAELIVGEPPSHLVVGGHTFVLATPTATPMPAVMGAPASRLWPGFSPSVLYWEALIARVADAHGVDPNQAAIIMQIESCGDPQAISRAGAQGLFQVMPLHFAAGEDALDPDTNAMRGLAFYAEVLNRAGGDTGRAFAAYNGGWNGTAGGWDTWKHETQRYYLWSTGILAELQQGKAESETLGQWLRAGGASLCRQAEQRLGLTEAAR